MSETHTHRTEAGMFRSFRGVAGGIAACSAYLLISIASRAQGEDIYFHRAVSELTVTEGRLPQGQDAEQAHRHGGDRGNWRVRTATQPYAVIEDEGEIYLGRALNGQANSWGGQPLDALLPDDVVAIRIPVRREVVGRLFAPKVDGTGMVVVTFKVAPPTQEDAKAVFALAKRRHYERLLARNLPGAAWFGHQVREADALAQGRPANGAATNAVVRPGTELERTFDLFSGGRAVDENLQLDRPLPRGAPASTPGATARVDTESLKGISVAEMDWSARLKGRTPALDSLAANIPADQHAVFFPSLKAAAAVLAEFHGDAMPVLNLVATRSEDSQVRRRYERQLGVSFADLGRVADGGAIRGLAVTGSDPYLPSGTDLAVLIDTGSPEELTAFLKARLDAARRAEPEAEDVGGEWDGVTYAGARTTDRRLSSYVATLGKVVVVANSMAQVKRLVETTHDKTPRLADQPEYQFFRDRYRQGDGDESALLVLTDATIRRWCGPRWRIGSSRRVRAAAALAELQAASLAGILGEETKGATLQSPTGSIDIGTTRLTRRGMRSETYGTLVFQTPIVELPLAEVDRSEADAYNRWRDTYQQNWRGVFDPIAVRLGVRPDRLSADVSVMPLIAGTDYRPFLELVGDARIAPDAGDRHPDTLFHAIMALDAQAKLVRQGGDQLAAMTRVPQQVAFGWLGRSVAVYLDDDPFWKELAAAEDPQQFFSDQINRLPVGVHVEVTDGVKLALFLSGLRAFVDQSAPNLTNWENREHRGQRYVRVAEAEGARANANGPKFALYYVATPGSLTVSLNEGVVRRFIERHEAEAKPGPDLRPWKGHSLAFQASHRGLEVLGAAGRTELRDELRVRSWGNLPILNEWKRLFHDRYPLAFHEAVWGTKLVDPGGGQYVWNGRWATMESTVFGHPGEPKPGDEMNNPISRFGSANLGLSFEDGGLRARAEVEVEPVNKP